ncbi:MAG TPA: glycosyltransferase [Campylobacterales bacterium]|nr:glycosyltransferase [Campylobacterales bacterium]
MRIVHILPKFDTGGAEKFCVDMCNTLAKDTQNQVYLVVLGTIDDDEILAKQVDESIVSLISLNKQGKSLKVIYDIYALLKKIKPDVTHTHMRAQAYAGLPLILASVPNIHTIHNLAQKEIGAKVRKFYNFLYTRFNFTPVAISDEVLISMHKEYGTSFHEKINNGAKALVKSPLFDETKAYFDSLRDSHDTNIFVSVGRLSGQKNYIMMIAAFEELLEEGIDAKLLIIGSKTNDKPYALECEASIKSTDKIFLLGEKSNIGDYLYNCDAFTLSSLYEGMPISILEAMSASKATISTPVGGIVDIIQEGVNGYLSEDVSKESYKEAVKRFLEKPTHDGEKTRAIFDNHYSIERTVKDYMDLYKKVVEKN